ncbi:MAG: tRNA pseudouridine(55) synthase TruB [Holosporales bacterium]|jgi:tRNA pseudouridine55 synthase|nr:tRNA pseudouridine(55) synthase TruB [Holosporales bacterium]
MNQPGIIILDKPVGKSSAFITRIIGRKVGAKKVGHLGTLDPFATGVLPIAFNSATKLIPYIKSEQKTYIFEVFFGEKRETGDITGNIIETSDFCPSKEEILSVLQYFTGNILQIPHRFSAVKINGKKAYEIARTGGQPNLKERPITIFSLNLLNQASVNSYVFEATVSPGTYIRTLAEDIANKLGSVAYVKNLRRIQDGQFSIHKAVTMELLENLSFCIDDILQTPEFVLENSPANSCVSE